MTKLEFEELQHKFHYSGKTLNTFLKEKGIAYSTYNYWSKKLRDEAVSLPIENGLVFLDCVALRP